MMSNDCCWSYWLMVLAWKMLCSYKSVVCFLALSRLVFIGILTNLLEVTTPFFSSFYSLYLISNCSLNLSMTSEFITFWSLINFFLSLIRSYTFEICSSSPHLSRRVCSWLSLGTDLSSELMFLEDRMISDLVMVVGLWWEVPAALRLLSSSRRTK